MIPDFTSMGGVTVNGVSPYIMVVPDDEEVPYELSVESSARAYDTPVVTGWSGDPRVLPFVVAMGPGAAGLTSKQWADDAWLVFGPYGGIRTLRGTWEGETVEAEVLVRSFGPAGIGIMRGELQMVDPIWRSQTLVPALTTSPIAAPGGNMPAAPTLTVAPTGTNAKLFKVQLTNPQSRDVGSLPVVVGGGTIDTINHLTLDTTGVGATLPEHYAVYGPDGQSIPFFVLTPNHATATRFFFKVSIAAGETIEVWILCGSTVSNLLNSANYDTMGWDVANASIGNHKWIWLSTPTTIGGKPIGAMFQLSKNPRITGSFFTARLGSHPTGSSFRFRQTATQAFFDVLNTDQYPEDADGIMIVTQVPLAAGTSITGITATLTGTGGDRRMKYLLPGEVAWQDITGAVGSQAAAGATQLAYYIEANGTGTGALEVGGTPQLVFDTTKIVTLALAATITDMRRLEGYVQNDLTEDAVVFEDVWVDGSHAVTVRELDPREMGVTAGGTIIGVPKVTGTDGYFRLLPGQPNSWSVGGGLAANVTFEYVRRYAA